MLTTEPRLLTCGRCGDSLPASIAQAVIAHEKLVEALKDESALLRSWLVDATGLALPSRLVKAMNSRVSEIHALLAEVQDGD